MKTLHTSLLLLPVVMAFSACEQKTPAEKTVDKVENKVKDATDSRPGEGIRDTAEDIKDSVKK